MKHNTDFKYSIICILVSIIFLVWLIPVYTPQTSIVGDISSDVLPNAMMTIILTCGIVMLVRSLLLKKEGAELAEADGEQVSGIRLLIVLLFIAAYLLLLNFLGFYVTTAAALPLAVWYFNRAMSWRKIVLSSALLLIFVYVLFEIGLSVKMPRGVLF